MELRVVLMKQNDVQKQSENKFGSNARLSYSRSGFVEARLGKSNFFVADLLLFEHFHLGIEDF